MLYEMLAGKHPFTAEDPAEMFAKHRAAEPPPIVERARGVTVPASLEAVVQRLLEKDPSTRYPHARAVIVALESVLAELAETEKSPGPDSSTVNVARASSSR